MEYMLTVLSASRVYGSENLMVVPWMYHLEDIGDSDESRGVATMGARLYLSWRTSSNEVLIHEYRLLFQATFLKKERNKVQQSPISLVLPCMTSVDHK